MSEKTIRNIRVIAIDGGAGGFEFKNPGEQKPFATATPIKNDAGRFVLKQGTVEQPVRVRLAWAREELVDALLGDEVTP